MIVRVISAVVLMASVALTVVSAQAGSLSAALHGTTITTSALPPGPPCEIKCAPKAGHIPNCC
jgi:hypothetical protein